MKVKSIQRKFILLTAVLFLSAVSIYGMAFFGPTSKVGLLSRELFEKRMQVNNLRNLSSQRTELINQINQLTIKINKADAQIPNQSYTSDFISSVYSWGKTHHVEILNIFPEYTEKRRGYKIDRVLIDANGSLEGIKAMTKFIGSSEKKITANMLTLQVNVDNTYSCRMGAELYSFGD